MNDIFLTLAVFEDRKSLNIFLTKTFKRFFCCEKIRSIDKIYVYIERNWD